jgi:hypothetical protein
VPIAFVVDPSSRFSTSCETKEKPMPDVLAPFLGHGA